MQATLRVQKPRSKQQQGHSSAPIGAKSETRAKGLESFSISGVQAKRGRAKSLLAKMTILLGCSLIYFEPHEAHCSPAFAAPHQQQQQQQHQQNQHSQQQQRRRQQLEQQHDSQQQAASNHTSFYLNGDTNATGAARLDDQLAIKRAAARAAAGRPDDENRAPLAEDERTARGGAPFRMEGAIEFDDHDHDHDDDDDDADAATQQLDEDLDQSRDDDYEDEQHFYTSNPVDSIAFELESRGQDERANAASELRKPREHNGGATFRDFDDLEALNLNSFYGKQSKRKKTTTKKRKKKANKTRPRTANRKRLQRHRKRQWQPARNASESRRQQRRWGRGDSLHRAEGGADCALLLGDGRCINFGAVEWAIERARQLIGFRRPSGRALNSLEPAERVISATGELNEWTSRLLAARFGLTNDELNFQLDQLDVSRTSLWAACPRLFRSPGARACATTRTQARHRGRFRSHTGQCNNPLAPHLGASFMPFARLIPADYADGLGSMRAASGSGSGIGAGGGPLPAARLVSLALHPPSVALELAGNGNDLGFGNGNGNGVDDDLSALFAAWGQLINHDLAQASSAGPATGHRGSCCGKRRASAASLAGPSNRALKRVCAPLEIAPDDPVYGPFGVRCHDFKRSIAALRPGCSLGPRTQLNLVSSFVDGSFVYGSSRSVSRSLRAPSGGRLATWNYFGSARFKVGAHSYRLKPLLPAQREAPDAGCLGRPAGLFCFRSGDARTNQQVPLVVLHTLHVRQHNRLARALAQLNPHWEPGRLYEEARRIHVAQIQHILIGEYLPLLLGARACAQFNLTALEPADGHWHAYEPLEQPAIAQEFAAAAFRQGHSAVADRVFRFELASRRPKRLYNLRELFHRPWPLFEPGALDEFALGLLETAGQTVDPFVSLELTGHLFEEPGEPVGLDLVAINIQRGRDQGVASYSATREWCGLGRLEDFEQLERLLGRAASLQMASLYESVQDIDLYSGGLSERPLEGAQVGETFACIIGHQFRALRAADRHWFEASPLVAGAGAALTAGQLASIKQFSLARLLCANSDALQLVQAAAMQLAHPILNPLVPCQALPDVDLSLWLEAPPAQIEDEDEERKRA